MSVGLPISENLEVRNNFSTFTSFKELLKCYREGLRVSSRVSLVITQRFMILRVAFR